MLEFNCVVFIEKYWRIKFRETMVWGVDEDEPLLGLKSRCRI
jgi:hypothetical protein